MHCYAAMRAPLLCALLAGGSQALAPRPVALGLVKYAHNACCCVVDATTGRLLFAGEKERLTRVKNDGGCVGDLVRHALQACQRTPEDVVSVIANDHHRPVQETEAAAIRASRLGISSLIDPVDVRDPCNFWDMQREMSHHRAHALGAVATFGTAECGLVLCMDGMGDRAKRFRGADAAHVRDSLKECVHVLNSVPIKWKDVPDSARECETVYREDHGSLTPIFKRWCHTQPENDLLNAYGDWFASPLDSLGAGYSHASHLIFGDWNACGKVMGLAPWGAASSHYDAGWGSATRNSWAARVAEASLEDRPRVYDGAVWPCSGEEGLRVDREALVAILDASSKKLDPSIAFPVKNLWKTGDDVHRACGAVLAHAIQQDLEDVALDFVKKARNEVPDGRRIILCGGVALNSVLNGKIEGMFPDVDVLVPPAPGDEGCALGCAVAALDSIPDFSRVLPRAGAAPDAPDEALSHFGEWLDMERIDDNKLIDECSEMIAKENTIVFWFEGRSEFGPRALGHRSIIAPATRCDTVDFINDVVKGREDFRPLAPAVLAEEAHEWFEGGCRASPFMSRVWVLKEEAARRVPACAHVDRTARPQTVGENEVDIARYRRLIQGVFRLIGVPIVLNTSFNTKPGEPIVETTRGAIASFLAAAARGAGDWDLVLCFPGILVRSRPCPIDDEGRFEDAARSLPVKRHDDWEVREIWNDDGASQTLYVRDLDEALEDADRTGRGSHVFLDELECRIYGLCDGGLSAEEIASSILDELDEDESDEVTREDVYLRLARLWRRTLIRLML